MVLLRLVAPIGQAHCNAARPGPLSESLATYSVALSITKRYLTSLRSIRS